MRLILSISFTLLAGWCSNIQAQQSAPEQPLWKTDIYRHYTGSIGGRPVALDLRWGCCLSNFGGSNYYYLDSEEAFLLLVPNPGGDEPNFNAKVYPSAGHWGFDKEPCPQWQFSIDGKRLTGTLYSADGNAPQVIDLTEDYSQAYPMTMTRIRDTATAFAKDGKNCLAETFFVVPGTTGDVIDEDAGFINMTLLQHLGVADPSIKDMTGYARAASEKYITAFRNNEDRVDSSRFRDIQLFPSYDTSVIVFPVYNHDGIIVFDISTIGRRDGNKHTSGSDFLCIDVHNREVWKMDDILLRDDEKLTALLEYELKEILNIPASDKLSDPIIVKSIPVSDNVIITQHGLKFYYHREEILNDKYGDLFITVSYNDLGEMLKDKFKKRMRL